MNGAGCNHLRAKTPGTPFSALLGGLGRKADEYGVVLQAKGCSFGLI